MTIAYGSVTREPNTCTVAQQMSVLNNRVHNYTMNVNFKYRTMFDNVPLNFSNDINQSYL